MRTYSDISVDRAAVHVVAPRRGELRTSSSALLIDEPVQSFLAAHVTKGLGDSGAVAANFKVVGATRVEGLCRGVIEDSEGFVDATVAIAQHLFEASTRGDGTDARVSDGTLVVARCAATSGDESVPLVALLKLDPNDAFKAVEVTADDGSTIVRLDQQHDILPTPKERLQKAAFVRSAGTEFDCLVIDRQTRGENVADYFMERFLGAETVFDAKARTTTLYRTLTHTMDDVRSELEPQEVARLDQYVQGQVVGGRANVDTIVDGMPVADSIKERFAAALAENLPDREFDMDEATAKSLVRRRRFRGDNGLALSVPSDFYDDMVTVEPPAGNDRRFTITIRTQDWHEQ